MKTLFITRDAESCGPLITAAKELQLQVFTQSLIRFERLNAQLPTGYDVLFFSSKNAVDFFVDQFELTKAFSIACVGEGTASYLRNLGHEVSFVGKGSGDAHEVGLQFRNWLKERKTLLVQSEQSAGSIASALDPECFHLLAVYRTVTNSPVLLPPAAICVFTSPMNVESWLNTKPVYDSHTIFIAWGKTTARSMEDKKLPVHHVLKSAGMDELLDLLRSL